MCENKQCRYCGDTGGLVNNRAYCKKCHAGRERAARKGIVCTYGTEDCEKWCNKCGTNLPKESFTNNAAQPDGLFPWCRECKRALDGKYKKSPAGKASAKKEYENNKREYIRRADERRARVSGASGEHTAAEWSQILESCGSKCVKCGSTQNIQKDHIVPLALGGTNDADNLQPLCGYCNCSKGAKLTLNWIFDLSGLECLSP